MKIEFWLREPGNHHKVGKLRTADSVPRVGDYVALSDDEVYTVHSVHWYFHNGPAMALVMLNP